MTDDQGDTTGPVSNGGGTDDTQPVVRVSLGSSGAVAGDILRLRNGSQILVERALLQSEVNDGHADITTPVLANGTSYSLNAFVTDLAGNVGSPSANFTLTVDTTAAGVSAVALSSAVGASNGFLNLGDTVTATVTFNEAVNVVVGASAPTLKLNVGGTLVDAAYTGGSGTAALSFAYTVTAGRNDDDGISIGANALSANGSTIRNRADRLAADAFAGDDDGEAVIEAAPLRPNPVTQDEMDAGSIELF